MIKTAPENKAHPAPFRGTDELRTEMLADEERQRANRHEPWLTHKAYQAIADRITESQAVKAATESAWVSSKRALAAARQAERDAERNRDRAAYNRDPREIATTETLLRAAVHVATEARDAERLAEEDYGRALGKLSKAERHAQTYRAAASFNGQAGAPWPEDGRPG